MALRRLAAKTTADAQGLPAVPFNVCDACSTVRALAEGRYEALLEQRLTQPQLRTRKIVIHVLYERETQSLVYRTADEGAGFNWRHILERSPDACDGKDASGRGIFLARSLFPNLTYNALGNEVMITLPLN